LKPPRSLSTDGSQLRRFAQHGQLNAPWGIVQTPDSFGELGGSLWIGNFGDGRISAYTAATGAFVINKVRDSDGKAIALTVSGPSDSGTAAMAVRWIRSTKLQLNFEKAHPKLVGESNPRKMRPALSRKCCRDGQNLIFLCMYR
jgi:hypothetical protein